MKKEQQSKVQIIARLAWVSHLGSWANVHAQMKPAVSGLVRCGLAERDERDNGLSLTDAGEQMLRDAGIPFVADLASNGTSGKANELVPAAKFWIDAWGQTIPA